MRIWSTSPARGVGSDDRRSDESLPNLTLRPRASEVQAVVTLLESGDYETSQDLARAILGTVAGELAKRDTYGVAFGLKTDDLRIPTGPYYDLRDAKSAQKRFEECGLASFTAPLRSPVPPMRDDSVKTLCSVCGHADPLHDSRGCWVYVNRARCECRGTHWAKGDHHGDPDYDKL